jgi:hypothetical protein
MASSLDRVTRLRRLGELLWGERWQSDMAAALSGEAGRRIRQGQVSTWLGGHRPMPDWTDEALARIAAMGAARLRRQADEAESLFG